MWTNPPHLRLVQNWSVLLEISGTEPTYCSALCTENKIEKVQRCTSELDPETEIEHSTLRSSRCISDVFVELSNLNFTNIYHGFLRVVLSRILSIRQHRRTSVIRAIRVPM